METGFYRSITEQYASLIMSQLFSQDMKYTTWRRLWLALAGAEKKLGVDISDEQLEQLEDYLSDINYDVVLDYLGSINATAGGSEEIDNIVAAHAYAFGRQAWRAADIIGLGATASFVVSNTEILNMRDGLQMLKVKLFDIIERLADFLDENKAVSTLCYYQSSSLTTVGKRAALWLQNFVDNLSELEFVVSRMRMLGCRGEIGSSENIMKLFDGDEESYKLLDYMIAEEFEFNPPTEIYRGGLYTYPVKHPEVYAVSGRAYPRNLDYQVLNILTAIGASTYKMAQDICLLQRDGEFNGNKNTMTLCGQVCSMARFLSGLPVIAWQAAATQKLEWTQEEVSHDIYMPDAFMASDAILVLCLKMLDGISVNRGNISAKIASRSQPEMQKTDLAKKCSGQVSDYLSRTVRPLMAARRAEICTKVEIWT